MLQVVHRRPGVNIYDNAFRNKMPVNRSPGQNTLKPKRDRRHNAQAFLDYGV